MRFLQAAQPCKSTRQVNGADDYPGEATCGQNPTSRTDWSDPSWRIRTLENANDVSFRDRDHHHRNTASKSCKGDSKPDSGSTIAPLCMANVNLLKRVSVGCPYRAWHNVNTRSVELEL
jgi:hypothetical protein